MMEHVDDYLVEFLTPEALLLFVSTNDYDNQQPTDQLDSATTAQAASSLQSSQRLSHKRESSDGPGDTPESSTSSIHNGTATNAKRAKFNPKRRAEVAELRKKGVCFRCKVSKAKGGCSNELPCQACVRSQAATTGRKPLRPWMQCVAFAIGDADFFAIDFPCTEERYLSILQSSDRIVTQDLEVAFESLVFRDVSTISKDIAMWLSDVPAAVKLASRVGVLASSTFQRLVSPLIEDSLSKHARLLMEISFVLRSDGGVTQYTGYTIEELRHLQSFAGTQVIRGLDAALRNPFDKGLSVDKGQALFLMLFSVIVAVANYSQQSAHPLEVTSYVFSHSQKVAGMRTESVQPRSAAEAHAALQQQLLRILAHHMIHMADRLNLLHPDTAKDLIVQDAASELSRKACFQWVKVIGFEELPANSPHQNTTLDGSRPAKWPRQAILTDKMSKLLPLELCQNCSQEKKWINLKNGICLDCRVTARVLDLPSYLLSIHKIMTNRDRAAHPISDDDIPSHMPQGDLKFSDAKIDPPEPNEPFNHESGAVIGPNRPQLSAAVASTITIPIWEMCVWCDNKSGPDGLCDTCRTADDPYYNVEHTNFPLGQWLEF